MHEFPLFGVWTSNFFVWILNSKILYLCAKQRSSYRVSATKRTKEFNTKDIRVLIRTKRIRANDTNKGNSSFQTNKEYSSSMQKFISKPNKLLQNERNYLLKDEFPLFGVWTPIFFLWMLNSKILCLGAKQRSRYRVSETKRTKEIYQQRIFEYWYEQRELEPTAQTKEIRDFKLKMNFRVLSKNVFHNLINYSKLTETILWCTNFLYLGFEREFSLFRFWTRKSFVYVLNKEEGIAFQRQRVRKNFINKGYSSIGTNKENSSQRHKQRKFEISN